MQRPVLGERIRFEIGFAAFVLAFRQAFGVRQQRGIELAHPLTMLGGDGDHVAEAQPVGLEYARLAGFALGLVSGNDHGRAAPAQNIGEDLVRGRDPRPRIDQK